MTFHRERKEKKKEGKDYVKKMSTEPNLVKRKEKWRIQPKNRIHPLSMPNGKKEINIRMEAPFGGSEDMGKCVPYIFLHNFTGVSWCGSERSLTAVRCCCLLGSIPDRKGVQAPLAPGFKPPSGSSPWAAQVPPTERAGSKGSYKVLWRSCIGPPSQPQ